MSKKIADLAIASGSYVDKNGNEKTKWEHVGGLWEGNCGKKFITIKRIFNPAGVNVDADGTNKDSIVVNVFDIADKRSY